METNHRWPSRLCGIACAIVVVTAPAGGAVAAPIETVLVPGVSVRNGDWVAVDGLGIALLSPREYASFVAAVLRGELAIGGISAGVGLATNVLSEPCPSRGCDMSVFLGSGILSLEGRVERMFGPTSWRRTTYVGAQVSLATIFWKPAVGLMIAPDDPRDHHWQITFIGGGW
jgi:hypothetical protein